MSHSHRKTPILAITTAVSEKDDKKFVSRWRRRATKQALAVGNEPVDREHQRSGGWNFAKDGRQWIGTRFPKLMRK